MTTPPQSGATPSEQKQKRVKLFYIKERHNPQTGIYCIREGQLSKAAARRMERSLYGSNTMHSFATEKEYEDRMKYLVRKGNKVL